MGLVEFYVSYLLIKEVNTQIQQLIKKLEKKQEQLFNIFQSYHDSIINSQIISIIRGAPKKEKTQVLPLYFQRLRRVDDFYLYLYLKYQPQQSSFLRRNKYYQYISNHRQQKPTNNNKPINHLQQVLANQPAQINKISMNFSTTGFRYKVLEANVLNKLDNCHSSFDSHKQHHKPIVSPYSINTNTGKNYSTIKSLMRRMETAGKVKINYPRIKTRSERNDIFLRGGSINQIKKAEFQMTNKSGNKKSPISNKKTFIKINLDRQYMDEIHQVFISKNIPLETRKQNVFRSHQSVKTQNQKPISLNFIAKTVDKRFVVETPILEHLDFRNFVEDSPRQNKQLRAETDQSELSNKFERTKGLISLRQTDITATRVAKRTVTTSQGSKIQQNMSENHIPTYSSQSRKVKIPPQKIVKQMGQPKHETKKQVESLQQQRKPVFYLSQDELKNMNLTTKSFIVMEYPTKQIITGSYFRQVCQIASLTKTITFYCCLLLVEKYDINIDEEILVIDQQVESITGTSAELLEGDMFTFRQICYGLMLPSGNDAALAMAKWGGRLIKKWTPSQTQTDLKVFMAFMNSTCLSIGMKSSFFGNPHGLPHPKSGSTVQDVALVIYQALRIQFFREVIKTKSYKCWVQNNDTKRQVLWQNTNKLLRRNGFIGVKTGVTVTAGPCLATCYQTGDKIYIIILVKTSKLSKRFKQTRRILGKALAKINFNGYKKQIREIEKNDVEFDSDNSEDEQEFSYDRNDAQEMKKRLKIITYQM